MMQQSDDAKPDCEPSLPTRYLRALIAFESSIAGIARDLDPLYRRLEATAAMVMPVDACYVGLYDPEQKLIFFPYNVEGGVLDVPTALPLGTMSTSYAIRNKKTYVASPATRESEARATRFGDPERETFSQIHAPIHSGRDDDPSPPIGVFSVQAYPPDCYDALCVTFVELLAIRAAAHIYAHRQWNDLRQAAIEAEERARSQAEYAGSANARAMARFMEFGSQLNTLRSQLPRELTDLRKTVDTLCNFAYAECASIRPDLIDRPTFEDPLDQLALLSEREKEVFMLLANDLTYRDIADRLGVSTETIKTHLKRVYEKLGVAGRVQASQLAIRAAASRMRSASDPV